MHVEYTRLDGTTVIYTNNTTITSNVAVDTDYLDIDPPMLAILESDAESVVHDGSGQIFITRKKQVYDYGMHVWAEERLNAKELADFAIDQQLWSSLTEENKPFTPEAQKSLDYWWDKFEHDPNVIVHLDPEQK